MKKVMFVCTGNICRSAMAEAMLRHMANEEKKEVTVYSCGIYAETGTYATYDAIEVMKEYDIDLSKHIATNIEKAPIQEMDLILCATVSHKELVRKKYPSYKNKIYTMKEYDNEKMEDLDIADPWGHGLTTYRKCASQIQMVIQKLLKKI